MKKIITIIFIICIIGIAIWFFIIDNHLKPQNTEEMVDLRNNEKWLNAGLENDSTPESSIDPLLESLLEPYDEHLLKKNGVPSYAYSINLPNNSFVFSDGYDVDAYPNFTYLYDTNTKSSVEITVKDLSVEDAIRKASDKYNSTDRYLVYKHVDTLESEDYKCEKYKAEDIDDYYDIYFAAKEINSKTITVILNAHYNGTLEPAYEDSFIADIFNNIQSVKSGSKEKEGSFIIYG